MRKETLYLCLFLIFDLAVMFVFMDTLYQKKHSVEVETSPVVQEVSSVEYEEADYFFSERGIKGALMQHLPTVE